MRHPTAFVLVAAAAWLASVAASAAAADVEKGAAALKAEREAGAVTVKSADGKLVLRYQLEPLADIGLPVESACYFHPLTTPAGAAVTDVAPPDHPHHRGIFLGWVEMHGKDLDGDFWGWGAHAPTKGRRIVNDALELLPEAEGAGFVARNRWVAGEKTMVNEDLRASVARADGDRPGQSAHVLDLTYTLTVPADVRVARWAFSGFCVRTPRGGPEPEAYGPDGAVDLPNPSHTDPASDWPAAAFYGYTFPASAAVDAAKADTVGVAVIDHPDNPQALWHNHRAVRMLNPAVCAPGDLMLKSGRPLVLRYRVVAHDGPRPMKLLTRLAEEWAADRNDAK